MELHLNGNLTKILSEDSPLTNVSETKPATAYPEAVIEWIDGMQSFQHNLEIYLPPILIIFGISGNTMSLLVLRSRHFRQCPCSVLLCFMAVVDTGVLLTGLLRGWLISLLWLDIRTLCSACCRIHYFVTYLLQHLSSWTIVMVTLERMVSVFRPFQAKRMCSHRKLLQGILFIVLCLVSINSYSLFRLDIQRIQYFNNIMKNYTDDLDCAFHESDYFGQYVWPWIDYFILALLPFAIVATGNIMIGIQVIVRKRRILFQDYPNSQPPARPRRVASLTLMLFSVTTTFFLTTTPIEVYLIGYHYDYWNDSPPINSTRLLVTYVILNLIFYFNNTLNFLLYCISGSRFRRALQDFYKYNVKRVNSARSTLEEHVTLAPWSMRRRRYLSSRSSL